MCASIKDEVAKLRMKVAETDAINQALRDDVDKSFAREAASVREVEIKLDKSQFESRRLEGLISEAQAKADADSVRRTVLERELAAAEDEGFKKERALREERHRVESLEAAKVRWDEARALLEEEVTMIKQELSHEKAQAVREIERIRTEVEAKLPQLANSAVEQMHSVVADRVQQGVNSNVQRFTQDVAALEKEIKHSEALIANKENEYLTRLTEAKARELALKDQCDQLQRRNQDLASQVPSSIRAIPGSPPHSSFTTPEQMQANPNARYEVQPRTLPNDLYSYIHATAFHDPLESAMVSINQQLESLRAQLSFAFNTPSLYSTHRSFPLLHHSPPKDWSSMPSLSLLTPPLSRAIEPVPGFSKYDASTQKLRWKMEQQQNRLRQQIGSFNVFTSPNSAYCQQQQQGAPQWQQRFANLQSQFDALNQRLDASQRGSDAETISPVSPSNVSPETDSEVDLTRNERYVSTSEFGHPLSSVDTSILFTDFNGGFHPNYWKAKYLPNRK